MEKDNVEKWTVVAIAFLVIMATLGMYKEGTNVYRRYSAIIETDSGIRETVDATGCCVNSSGVQFCNIDGKQTSGIISYTEK